MSKPNYEGLQKEVVDIDTQTILQLLSGLRDQLIYVANYMDEHGIMTQEEIRRLDVLRHMITGKVLQVTQ